mmetsp:Transcript_15667/g.13709  ORF Transcript_15667/g.13709 Transcript_15667/m.13709 type:complete len:204 (+) Transcript_15667:133-744(+)
MRESVSSVTSNSSEDIRSFKLSPEPTKSKSKGILEKRNNNLTDYHEAPSPTKSKISDQFIASIEGSKKESPSKNSAFNIVETPKASNGTSGFDATFSVIKETIGEERKSIEGAFKANKNFNKKTSEGLSYSNSTNVLHHNSIQRASVKEPIEESKICKDLVQEEIDITGENNFSTVFGDFESENSPKDKEKIGDLFEDKPIDF